MNSTWLITSELANQRARKVLFTCVVYTNNSNRVYVLGHKYVLGPFQAHFSPRLAARAKMSLSRAQNIFMPANINSIVIL